MDLGKPIREWTIEPIVVPIEAPKKAPVDVPVRETEPEKVPA